jgi:hypothetical protein
MITIILLIDNFIAKPFYITNSGLVLYLQQSANITKQSINL